MLLQVWVLQVLLQYAMSYMLRIDGPSISFGDAINFLSSISLRQVVYVILGIFLCNCIWIL